MKRGARPRSASRPGWSSPSAGMSVGCGRSPACIGAGPGPDEPCRDSSSRWRSWRRRRRSIVPAGESPGPGRDGLAVFMLHTPAMGLRMLFELLVEAARSFSRDRASSMGAALAYYTMLSIAPTVLIVVSVVGLVFGEEAARGEVVEQLRQLVGDNGANAVEALLERMNRPTSGILGTVGGLLAMIIGATTVFSELQASLDKVWQAPEQPKSKGIMGFVRTRLLSLSLVLSFGFLILVSLLASAALAALQRWWLPVLGPFAWIAR